MFKTRIKKCIKKRFNRYYLFFIKEHIFPILILIIIFFLFIRYIGIKDKCLKFNDCKSQSNESPKQSEYMTIEIKPIELQSNDSKTTSNEQHYTCKHFIFFFFLIVPSYKN